MHWETQFQSLLRRAVTGIYLQSNTDELWFFYLNANFVILWYKKRYIIVGIVVELFQHVGHIGKLQMVHWPDKNQNVQFHLLRYKKIYVYCVCVYEYNITLYRLTDFETRGLIYLYSICVCNWHFFSVLAFDLNYQTDIDEIKTKIIHGIPGVFLTEFDNHEVN